MKTTVDAAAAKTGNSFHPHAKAGRTFFAVAVSVLTWPPMVTLTRFCINAGWKRRQTRKGKLSV
jgi:hypothetical protein